MNRLCVCAEESDVSDRGDDPFTDVDATEPMNALSRTYQNRME